MTRKLHLITAVVIILFVGCKSISKYPIDDPKDGLADKRLIGEWKAIEDTNRSNIYTVSYEDDEKTLHLKLWDREGRNPKVEGPIFVSEVSGIPFINVPYFEENSDSIEYFFLRILSTTRKFDSVTICLVADTTMIRLNSSKEVRTYITRNLSTPAFYSDTVHFYMIE